MVFHNVFGGEPRKEMKPGEVHLRVCSCGITNGRIHAEHTIDIHDELTGVCRSVNPNCGCKQFVDSGRKVIIQNG